MSPSRRFATLVLILFSLPAGLWAQPTKLVAADPGVDDRFGFAVATDGGTLVVGAPFDNDVADDSGSIYGFLRDAVEPDDWRQVQKLLEPDPELMDEFGFAISIDGDTMAVGVEDDRDVIGSVVIFERGADRRWRTVRQIFASDPITEDSFGLAVDLDGDTLVVGTLRGIFRDGQVGDDMPGVAYVFERHHGGADRWGEVARLTASDGHPGDYFGFAVAVAGDVVVVGSPGDADEGQLDGAAYVYERDHGGPGQWGEAQKLLPRSGPPAGLGDHFGWSVAFATDGSRLLVGAPRADDRGADSGAVHVFTPGGAGFEEQIRLSPADGAAGDNFGFSLALDGRFAAIGAPFDDDNGGNSGSAYVLERADDWRQVARVTAPDGVAGDRFGQAIALDQGTLVVGAPEHDASFSGAGAAYVYRLRDLLPSDCIVGDPESHCLRNGRFKAEITWRDFTGGAGTGKVAPLATEETGLFWFFSPDNWEIQVKVLDGCGFNGSFWVFGAASTNVEYVLRVTDTSTGVVREYPNPLGNAAPAITDTAAFATCP